MYALQLVTFDQIDSYKSVLNDKLSVIDMPNDCLNCENVLCNNNDQANLIQQMHDDIISACIDASKIFLQLEIITINCQVGMNL